MKNLYLVLLIIWYHFALNTEVIFIFICVEFYFLLINTNLNLNFKAGTEEASYERQNRYLNRYLIYWYLEYQ